MKTWKVVVLCAVVGVAVLLCVVYIFGLLRLDYTDFLELQTVRGTLRAYVLKHGGAMPRTWANAARKG